MISGVGGPGLQVETSWPWADGGGERNLAFPVATLLLPPAASCVCVSLMEGLSSNREKGALVLLRLQEGRSPDRCR